MQKLARITASVCAVLLFSFTAFAADADRVRTLLGPDVLKIINDAQSTEIYRLSGDPDRDADPATWKKGPVWDAKRTREAADLILSDSSYLLNIAKPCKPRFGVLLILVAENKRVELRLCFECTVLEISCNDPKFAKSLHFEPSRAQWTHWVKQAFPDDTVIQGLKEKDMPPEEIERIQNVRAKLERELLERKLKDANDAKNKVDGDKK